jgi:hypothetical protein
VPVPARPVDPLAHDELISAMRRAGATSAASARSLDSFPPVPSQRLAAFLEAGIVCKGRPGTYYLHEATDLSGLIDDMPRSYSPLRVAAMMAVWIIALLIPLLAWMFA